MTAPLKRIAELHVERGRADVDGVLSLDAIESGTGRLLVDPWVAPVVPPQAGVADAASGDVLFGKLRPYLAKVIHLDRPVYASTELMCLRTRAGVDSRWFFYRMIAQPTVEWAVATSEGTKMPRTSWERLSEFRVHVPAFGKQRAIADYLDTETARIDALIARKQRLDALLAERKDAQVAATFSTIGVNLHQAMASHASLPKGWRRTTLGRVLTQLTNGYVGPTRDILVESGVQYIQGMHIKGGRIEFERRPFFVSEEWHRARPRISLSAGDILIVQTGDIGRVAVVPDDLGPASCHALLIARPNRDLVSSAYLGMYLQSSTAWHEMLRLATGALHPHLEFGIKAVPVLVPPKSEQANLVVEIRNRQRQIDLTRSKLSRQIKLLQEHRQALITSAVTGALEIPEVAS